MTVKRVRVHLMSCSFFCTTKVLELNYRYSSIYCGYFPVSVSVPHSCMFFRVSLNWWFISLCWARTDFLSLAKCLSLTIVCTSANSPASVFLPPPKSSVLEFVWNITQQIQRNNSWNQKNSFRPLIAVAFLHLHIILYHNAPLYSEFKTHSAVIDWKPYVGRFRMNTW